MNTKMSTVGSLLLALENETVQLCYAPANVYNVERYADPDDDYYLLVPDLRQPTPQGRTNGVGNSLESTLGRRPESPNRPLLGLRPSGAV